MEVIQSPDEVRNHARQQRAGGLTVGVVPTMGALHAGHASLIEAARERCDYVIATIFVNPTQFGPNEDFERYPRTLDDDLKKCAEAGADLVFTPETSHMYRPDAECDVRVKGLTQKLEGRLRPGHFDGVTTVVAKLFNITVPDVAFFGQKDFQQQLVIRRMVLDLDWGIEIVTCPIIREPDGLAMSSRNRYLSAEEREQALVLYQSLVRAAEQSGHASPQQIATELRQQIGAQSGVELDYAVVVDEETLEPATDDADTAVALVAARLGKTRLIDNLRLRFR
ncbi:MAG: pantoate--beta-alanine ligase [Planctomycetaceae bacterium]